MHYVQETKYPAWRASGLAELPTHPTERTLMEGDGVQYPRGRTRPVMGAEYQPGESTGVAP